MTVIGITELNQQTSRVIREVSAGARIDVSMHGRVVARIVPAAAETTWVERKLAEGRVRAPSDPAGELPDPVTIPSGRSVDELIDATRAED